VTHNSLVHYHRNSLTVTLEVNSRRTAKRTRAEQQAGAAVARAHRFTGPRSARRVRAQMQLRPIECLEPPDLMADRALSHAKFFSRAGERAVGGGVALGRSLLIADAAIERSRCLVLQHDDLVVVARSCSVTDKCDEFVPPRWLPLWRISCASFRPLQAFAWMVPHLQRVL
jgi:hypothetical protein